MDTTLLTWYQGLQLLALGPCIFIIFFLCITATRYSKIIVPLLYFFSLACSFMIPIYDAIGLGEAFHLFFLMGESLLPAFSFLLIIEFATGAIPSPLYWTILLLPLIGSSSIIYLSAAVKTEICIYETLCALPQTFKSLYEIFSNCFIFLLIVSLYRRLGKHILGDGNQGKNRVAIITALILLNLIVLMIKLLHMHGDIPGGRTDIAITVVRIGFIYVVLTSIFRIFDRSLEINSSIITQRRTVVSSDKEKAIIQDINKIMEEEKIYHTMELTREMLARKLAITENQLSRVINQNFSSNFNTMINSWRIKEAKILLASTENSITDIAFAVGFNSIPSFNRAFKQVTGFSPTEYRSKARIAV